MLTVEFKDYYATLGCREDGHRRGDQEGVPQAGAQAPSRPQPGRQGRRERSSRRSTRPTRSSAIPRSAGSTTSSAPTGGSTSRRSSAPAAGRRAGFRPGSAGEPGGGDGYRTMTPDEMRDMFGGGGRRSVLGLLPHVLRRRRRRSAAAGAARRGHGAAPRRGPRSRAAGRSDARGGVHRHDARRVSISTTARRAPSKCAFPPASRTARACAPPAKAKPARGGAAGDLYLRVRLLPHARFERRGQDLHVRVAVPVTTAVLGGEVDGADAVRLDAAAEDAGADGRRAACSGCADTACRRSASPTSAAICTPTVEIQISGDAVATRSASTTRR